MRVFFYPGTFRHERLYEELAAVAPLEDLGVGGLLEGEDWGGDTLRVTVADSVNKTTVNSVVAAHNPALLSSGETVAANETTLRERADQAIANLEQAWNNWGSLTAAQKDATLKLNVRVTVALARLTLHKLDST